MAAHSSKTHRVFVLDALEQAIILRLGREQSHYLANVLRLSAGARVLVFNGRDGEWLASIASADKKGVELRLIEQTRAQPARAVDLHYCFAPLKHARLDYMVQKAVEMGVSMLRPILTRHTQVARVNRERMQANAVEAAEQCGVLAVPEVAPEMSLDALLANWEPGRVLIFCDEDAPLHNPIAALTSAQRAPLAVLIGPEGGFSQDERAAIAAIPGSIVLSLGPRILRADTAAVAALALVQATLGDWDAPL
jgi:16S rRNA (uracil1498-N3)-methyltransferase